MSLFQFRLRFDALVDFAFQIARSVVDSLLDAGVERLKPRLPLRHLAHIAQSLLDRDHQEHIFENDPAGVFEPAPRTGGQYPEYGLRQENPAEHMVERHHDRSRNQHAPVSVKSQKRQ